jgi:hypothetical protein
MNWLDTQRIVEPVRASFQTIPRGPPWSQSSARRLRSRALWWCLLTFGLAAETSHRRYRRLNWRRSYRNYRSGRGLWRRLLCRGSLLSRRRSLHPLLLARRGAAFRLLGFFRLSLPHLLRHVQPPDLFNQNYANDAGRGTTPQPACLSLCARSLIISIRRHLSRDLVRCCHALQSM